MKKLVLAIAVAVPAVVAGPSVAMAGWDVIGDGRLVVEQGPCGDWEAKNGWCGPSLIVRIPPSVTVYDDEASLAGTLEGPSGSVTLQYGTNLIATNGAAVTDADYWNYRTQTVAPTNLPYGTYKYTWNYSYPGQWKCSKYFRSGCIWVDDELITWTYKFDWQGIRIDTFPVQDKVPVITSSENNVTAASAKTLSTPKLANYMTGGGYSYSVGDVITLKKTSGSACKVVKGALRTVRRGTCKVQLTATTARGWKYVFKFVVKVK